MTPADVAALRARLTAGAQQISARLAAARRDTPAGAA